MQRVPLISGAYTARSITANCQRCVNLYPERLPEGSPVPFTDYPTPGLVPLSAAPVPGAGRGIYRATNNRLYAVVGNTLYLIAADWTFTSLGSLVGTLTTPVSMADNGTTLLIVDGSSNGYTYNFGTATFALISDKAFYGADRVDIVDGFFILNKPGSGIFYVSQVNSTTWDPLYFATKLGYSDTLVTVAVVHREIWLVGRDTTEFFVNSGAADFPFQIMTGAFVQHGCAAKYSIAQMGDALFWLSQDLQGSRVIVKGASYQTSRISTHAIETAMGTYSTVSDAVGFTYQQEGHQFYQISFPTADATWVYDVATELWHERVWSDGNGVEHRHRANGAAFAYDRTVVIDWETGAIYALDLNVYTDAGRPIVRIRSFPHLGNGGSRVFFRTLVADMEVGNYAGGAVGIPTQQLGVDGAPSSGTEPDSYVDTGVLLENGANTQVRPPALMLRWSDTRGASWSNPVSDDFGLTGDYLKSIQFQRLGMARDRVFELSWSAPIRTALNGAFVEMKSLKS